MAARKRPTEKVIEKKVVGTIDDHRVLVEYTLRVNARSLAHFLERKLDDSGQAAVLRSSFVEEVRAKSGG